MLTAELHILLICPLHADWFSQNFYNRDPFDEIIKRRGNTLCWLQNYVLLTISALCWQIFTRLLWQGFIWWDDWNEGQQPYASFKTAHFVKYLNTMLTDFHDTSITGVLLMRWSKWGATHYANFKTAHFVEYLGTMLIDCLETSITGIFLWDYKKSLVSEDLLHHPLLPAFNLHTHTYIYTCVYIC